MLKFVTLSQSSLTIARGRRALAFRLPELRLPQATPPPARRGSFPRRVQNIASPRETRLQARSAKREATIQAEGARRASRARGFVRRRPRYDGRTVPEDAMLAWLNILRRREVRYPPAPAGSFSTSLATSTGAPIASPARTTSSIETSRDLGAAIRRRRSISATTSIVAPNSKGVLDRLVARSTTVRLVALRGNHEIMMEAFLRGLTSFEDWRRLGGLETILSYGVDARGLLAKGGIQPRDLAEKVPASHLHFISSLMGMHTAGAYCFVHAGIRPGVAIEGQSIADLAWIRDDFLRFSGNFGFIVVHGHTPVTSVDFLQNRINIDTGAYMTNRLSVLRIDADGVTVLEAASK